MAKEKTIDEMMSERHRKAMADMATKEEVENCLLFGEKATCYSKEELIAYIVRRERRYIDYIEEKDRQLRFITSSRR